MRIRFDYVRLFLILLLCMIPVGLFGIPGLKILWFGALGIMLSEVMIKKYPIYTHYDNWNSFYLFLYLLMHVISTFINNGNWVYNATTLIVMVSMTLVISCEICSNPKRFLHCLEKVLILTLITEFVLYLADAGSYFMDFACMRLYYICWALIYMLNHLNRKRNHFFYILSAAAAVITIIKPQIGSDGSANYEWTFYLIILILCMVSISLNHGNLWKILTGKRVFIVIIFLNLYFVMFQAFMKSKLFQFIIVDIMHKSGDISGRAGIWRKALSMVHPNILLGYGTSLAGISSTGDYWTEFVRIYGPHNQMLYILLSGGLITLMFYGWILYKVSSRLTKADGKYACIICAGILVSYLELLVTFRNMINCIPLFILLWIGYFLPIIQNETVVKKKRSWRI